MFHLENGWYFSREENGNVKIMKREDAEPDAALITAITMTPDDWASVVSSVCARGNRKDAFDGARLFHNLECEEEYQCLFDKH